MKHFDFMTIPQCRQRFRTLGDWWKTGETLHIRVSEMSDWRFMLAILFHELSEYCWCEAHGIKTPECDRWDAWYEKQYDSGAIPITQEAGDDPRAPYHKGHLIGTKFERFTIRVLGASWKSYIKECDHLMEA